MKKNTAKSKSNSKLVKKENKEMGSSVLE